MTPQERQLVDDLFARLATVENQPREPDAIAAINDGLRRAPNALYALVQTVLLQDEALKRAQARLEALGDVPEAPRGFLDSMRETVFGGARRGSVPSVRPGDTGQSPWAGQQQPQQAQQPQQQGGFGGGSFLGTAAAAAAGAIGGSLLMNSLGSMMGGNKAHAFGSDPGSDRGGDKTPWSDSSKGDLSRDAGLGDIGANKGGERQGFFDNASDTKSDGDDFDGDDFGDFTDGGGDGGD